MEQWLVDGGRPPRDLKALLRKIESYDNIRFTYNGVKYTMNAADIKKRIHSELCPTCHEFRAQLYIQQNKLVRPLVHDLIKTYIERNYFPTKKRMTCRNELYSDIEIFLKQYRYTLTRDSRRYITKEVLKDDSTQYRKYRIIKRI